MNNDYPMRLNKYLLNQGICSRRQADNYIKEGRIRVNGRVAKLGDKVGPQDTIDLDKKIVEDKQNKIYIAFNKPRGVVSHNPQKGEEESQDFFPDLPHNLAPLGRLDKASHGLMIYSDDGTIVDTILNPNNAHEKEYLIEVDKRITKNFLEAIRRGVNIEGYQTKRARIEKTAPRQARLVLTEGKKHQIRRMCAALGYQIQDLQRVRIKNITLGKLKTGEYTHIDPAKLAAFVQK